MSDITPCIKIEIAPVKTHNLFAYGTFFLMTDIIFTHLQAEKFSDWHILLQMKMTTCKQTRVTIPT